MISKRGLLTLSLGIGLCFHAAVVWGLHNFPLKTHFPSFQHTVARERSAHAIYERHKRTELIAEAFNHLHEAEPEVKDQLHDLHHEYAPSLEVVLTPPQSFAFDVEPFAFESSLHPAQIDEEELASLISQAPISTTTDMPPLAEVEFEDDPLDLETIASSEYFDVEVEYAPKRHRPGYVFKATFYPRSDVVFKRIGHNVFFILDRSNSIPRARYALNKNAVSEALNHLHSGDTFNILIFDNHLVRLAHEAVPWNPENVAEARAFLERQGHGGHFAATELYASLGKIIPQDVSDHEINTAILFTNGNTYLSQEKQRRLIADWSMKNQGKVCLYSIASGTGNNLPLLDLISSFNQGRLIYSQNHNELNSMIVNLLRTVQTPIGKEMVATAVTADKQTTVLLQPKALRLPDLYQQRPFVVYGSLNRPYDFVLFLQGKYQDRRFDIKKTISFEQAKSGSFSLERKWTQLLAHEFYANYLEDGNPGHLEAAKQLLRSMNIPTAWID